MKSTVCLGVVIAMSAAIGTSHAADQVSIIGSYQLVKRVLPGGATLTPPVVVGFQTYTASYRNFSVHWTDPGGHDVSLSLISRYELTPERYCEHPIYWMQNNLAVPGVRYTWPKQKEECSAVKVEGDRITFAINGEPVVATFDPTSFVAKAEGLFTDYWQRVK